MDDSFAGAKPEDFKIIDRTSAPEQAQEPETVVPPTAEAPIVDTPVEVEKPAEVAPVVTQVEQPIPTPPVEPTQATPPVVQKTWKDLLKEDGLDEKITSLVDYYKQNGNLKDYLQAVSVDYKGMQPEEIMRRDLQEQYPDVTPEELDYLYRKEVVLKYNLDPEHSPSDIDTAVGKKIMARNAEAIRAKFIEKQNGFIIPDKDFQGEQKRQIEEQQRLQAEQQQANVQMIMSSPVVQSLHTNKSIVLDAGDDKFNYAVDPKDLVDLTLNGEVLSQAMSTTDSSGKVVPDIHKMMIVAAVAKNPQSVFKALINYGKSLGKKEFHDKELENIQTGSGVSPAAEELTEGQAWKQYGVRRNF